ERDPGHGPGRLVGTAESDPKHPVNLTRRRVLSVLARAPSVASAERILRGHGNVDAAVVTDAASSAHDVDAHDVGGGRDVVLRGRVRAGADGLLVAIADGEVLDDRRHVAI